MSSEQLRVGLVAGTLGRGGAERQLYYQVKTMVSSGVTPMVASLSANEHWEEPIRQLGVDVRTFGKERSPTRRVAELTRLLHAFRPQVVQSAHFYTNLYVCAAARLLR